MVNELTEADTPEDAVETTIADTGGEEQAEEVETADASVKDDSTVEETSEDDISEITAVMRYGGKQYSVQSGQEIELLSDKDLQGEEFEVADILIAFGDQTVIGNPVIDGAYARLSCNTPLKSTKGINFKRRRRKSSSKRTKGFKISHAKCRVDTIYVPGLS